MKRRTEFEVRVTPEQRSIAAAALAQLPRQLKNPQVAAMLTEALQEPETAQLFAKNPKAVFKRCGVTMPKGVTIKVHLSTKKKIQLALPTDLPRVSRKKAVRRIDISDEDLISEGLAYGASKNSPTAKVTDDVFAGDHGDFGPPYNAKKDTGLFRNSGNTWDRLRGDDI